MHTSLFFTLFALIFVCGNSNSAYRKVCYFTNWAQYRPGTGRFLVSDINATLCTHIIYSFATIKNNRISTIEWNDETMYNEFMKIRQKNPEIKLLLAVGGWNFDLYLMTYMLSTYGRRSEFISSTIYFLRKYGFDGLDLDFQWPSRHPSPSSDREKFTHFVNETKLAYDREIISPLTAKLLLTIAIPADSSILNSAYEITKISRNLDFITIRTYDFAGSWSTSTGHHSPLYAPYTDLNQLSINSSINYLETIGIQLSKVNLGIPLYGRGFVLKSPAILGLKAPFVSVNPAGPSTREAGFLSYYEILSNANNPETKIYRPCDIQVPYLVQGNLWIGYDDVASILNKVDFIRKRNLGGFAVWAIDLDDFKGMYGVKYPLLQNLNRINEINFSLQFNCKTNSQETTTSVRKTAADLTTATATATKILYTSINTNDTNYPCNQPNSSATFNCDNRNPCTADNLARGKLYFPAENANQFIQCSVNGQCYTMSCAAGTVWDPVLNNCPFPPVMTIIKSINMNSILVNFFMY